MGWWAVLAAVPIVLVAGGLAAWIVDSVTHRGEVARNVNLAGNTVGGLGREGLTAVANDIATRFGTVSIEIITPDGKITTTAAELGVSIDVEATVEEALRVGRDDALPARPLEWFGSFSGDRDAPLFFSYDDEQVRRVLLAHPEAIKSTPSEPYLTGETGSFEVVPGLSGQGVSANDIIAALPGATSLGVDPIQIEVGYTSIAPIYGPDALRSVLVRAETLTGSPVEVRVNEFTAFVQPEVMRPWLSSDLGEDGEFNLIIDEERAQAVLERLMTPGRTGGGLATFDVVDGEVAIVASEQDFICCDTTAPRALFDGVQLGLPQPLPLPVRPVTPEEGIEEAESLGIIELVSEFTTPHQCCQSRVENIQLFADIVRGSVIEPGATFSLNEHVGRRTREKGFLPGGFIENGVLVSDIGGGVSQYATTFFNAAFFAGMDFVSYQAHSLYFSRYPRGREATISYPQPDLVIHNPTPYGILVWASYTDTSITVEMYSTINVRVDTSDATASSAGQCTRWTTPRTRTFEDGTAVEDSVFAQYRPKEGVDCAGNSTVPETTTTAPETTTSAPPPSSTSTTGAPPSSSTTTTAPPPSTSTTTTAPPSTTTTPTTTTTAPPPTSTTTTTTSG